MVPPLKVLRVSKMILAAVLVAVAFCERSDSGGVDHGNDGRADGNRGGVPLLMAVIPGPSPVLLETVTAGCRW
jgi:hypothetical protein